MGGLFPLVWRSLVRRRLRSVVCLLAVALGVAAILGVQVTLAALDDQARRVARERAGASDLDVRAVTAAALGDTDVAVLRALPGVTAAVPFLEKPVTARARPTTILAPTVSLVAVERGTVALRPLVLERGRLPAPGSADEVVLDRQVAEVLTPAGASHVLSVGDAVYLTTARGPDRFRIVGIATGTGGGLAFTRSAVYVDVATARKTFALGLRTPLVALHLRSPQEATAVARAAVSRLGSAIVVVDPRNASAEPLHDQRPLLALLVALAVVVGAGVTANSVALAATERRREIGLLRAAGASMRQVFTMFLAEAAILAAGGTLLGIALGLVLGRVLTWGFASSGSSPSPSPTWAMVASAVAGGAGSALLASAVPAWAARRLAPLAALRVHPGEAVAPPPLRLVGLVLGGAGLFAVTTLVGGAIGAVVGTLALLVSVVALLPWVVPIVGRILGTVLAPVLRQAPVAAANLARRRQRTALTEAALGIAVAAATATGILAASALRSADSWVDGLFVGDVLLASPATQPDGVASAVEHDAGVASATTVRYLGATLAQTPVRIAVVDPEVYARSSALDFLSGDRAGALAAVAGRPAVVVPVGLAEPFGWRLGDRLALAVGGTQPRTVEVEVAGVVAHSLPSGDGREAVLMGRRTALDVFGPAARGFDLLEVASGGAAQRVVDVASRYGMRALPVASVRSAVDDALGRFLAELGALAWLSVGIAMLAVVNTLVVNARLGTRELALLRAVRLSRRQALHLVLAEAALLVVIGCLVGAATGCLAAVTLLRASSAPGFALPYLVPILPTIGTALVVMGSAVAAALGPARRSARASIVAAIREE